MNLIIKLGIILFVVLGATDKVLGQEKRKQIQFIEIEEKKIDKISISYKKLIKKSRVMIVIRGLTTISISNSFESLKEFNFFQYEDLIELRENYNFLGYYK